MGDRKHLLALDDNRDLLHWTDRAKLELPSATYEDWRAAALGLKLDVRVESVIGWRFFREALADPLATVNAARSGVDHHARAVSITWRKGNQWATLFTAASWGDGATEESVDVHQETCHYLGAGTYPTPSGLGQATMRAHLWQEPDEDEEPELDRKGVPITVYRHHGYTTLNQCCTHDLHAHLVGGRAELPATVETDRAFEIDRHMAYVAEAGKPLPVGAATFLGECNYGDANEYPTWFGQCWVLVLEPLTVGPFAIRSPSGRLSFPTEPGRYTTWLWKEEAADAALCGCLVVPLRVWAWTRTLCVLAEWAQWIYDKRCHSPSERVSAYIKKAAVAAIGWHAMTPHRLVVEPATSEHASRDLIVNASSFPTDYAVKRVEDAAPRQMVHWASYIWMQARRSLYERQLAEIRNGNQSLASDFDSLVLARPTQLATSAMLGDWSQRALTNVKISAARWIESDELTKTPGVKR